MNRNFDTIVQHVINQSIKNLNAGLTDSTVLNLNGWISLLLAGFDYFHDILKGILRGDLKGFSIIFRRFRTLPSKQFFFSEKMLFMFSINM